MCLSCGCKQPNEAHQDERHITMTDIEKAAEASEISTEEVARNIREGFDQFGKTATPTTVGVSQTADSNTQGSGGPR